MITETDLGWVAGILEGEGYCGFNGSGRTPTISVSMTDEDVIQRLASIFEVMIGKKLKIYTLDRYPRLNVKWQVQYKIQLNGDSARIVMFAVIRLMGKRRRQRMWQVLNGYKQPVEKLDVKSIVSNIVKLNR